MRKYLIALVAGIFVVGGVALATDVVQQFYGNTTVNLGGQEENLGAFPGPEIYQDIVINGDLTVTEDLAVTTDLTISGDLTADKLVQGGGSKTEYSSTTALTLTNADICTYSILPIQPIASMNVTLPATSTITSCLTTAGQMMELVIENTATTTNNLTIVAGTGMDLQEPDGQNVVIGQNNFAWLKFIKQSDGNVVVSVDETIPAD